MFISGYPALKEVILHDLSHEVNILMLPGKYFLIPYNEILN